MSSKQLHTSDQEFSLLIIINNPSKTEEDSSILYAVRREGILRHLTHQEITPKLPVWSRLSEMLMRNATLLTSRSEDHLTSETTTKSLMQNEQPVEDLAPESVEKSLLRCLLTSYP